MTLVSSIITQALRESNVIALGANPNPGEAAEALDRLQSIVLSVLGNEVGFVLEDWNIVSATSITKPSSFTQPAAGFTVAPQSRLVCNLSEATSLDLDPLPQDGQRVSVIDIAGNFATRNLTLDGNGRKIEGSATKVLSTNGTAQQWVYRADTGNWVTVDPLTDSSEMPFPEEFDDFFIIMLAGRMNPRFGRELSETSVARLAQQRQQMMMRYNQTRLREATQMQSPQGGLKGGS